MSLIKLLGLEPEDDFIENRRVALYVNPIKKRVQARIVDKEECSKFQGGHHFVKGGNLEFFPLQGAYKAIDAYLITNDVPWEESLAILEEIGKGLFKQEGGSKYKLNGWTVLTGKVPVLG
jgi:hypothetical protein